MIWWWNSVLQNELFWPIVRGKAKLSIVQWCLSSHCYSNWVKYGHARIPFICTKQSHTSTHTCCYLCLCFHRPWPLMRFPTQAHPLDERSCGICGSPDIGDRKWLTWSRCGSSGETTPPQLGKEVGVPAVIVNRKGGPFFFYQRQPCFSFCQFLSHFILCIPHHFLAHFDDFDEARGWGFLETDRVLPQSLHF